MERPGLLLVALVLLVPVAACEQILGLSKFTNCNGGDVDDPASCGGASSTSSTNSGGGKPGCTPRESVACYTGAKGTENVGECRGGMKTCKEDGSAFGPCEGETIPAAEDYDEKGDENCDGIPSADTNWVLIIDAEDGGTAAFTGVASDASGDLYAVGGLTGRINVGPNTLVYPGAGEDGFLAKVDATGHAKWGKAFPGASFGGYTADGDVFVAPGSPVAFDASTGHVVVAGTTTGVDFGASTGPVAQGAFAVAFDTSGAAVWSAGCAMSGALNVGVSAVAVDAAGNVFVGGTFQGVMACGPHHLTSASPASYSGYVVKFNKAGSATWAVSWGDPSSSAGQTVMALAATTDGSVWLTGWLGGSTTGEIALTAAAPPPDIDILFARIKPDGSLAYATQFGQGAAQQYGSAVRLDEQGNVYLGGTNGGTVNFGGADHQAIGTEDLFVAAFDATGSYLWSQDYGGAGSSDGVDALGVEPDGTVVISGEILGGVDFGQGAFVSDASTYAYLTRLAPKPSPSPPATMWSKYYGGNKSVPKDGVAVTAMTLAPRAAGKQRDVILVGQFGGAANFGTGRIGGNTSEGAFVVSVAP